MRYNPFKPGSLLPPGIFTGRTEEINSMLKALHQAQNESPQHFIIEGEKGIGKSSLFLFLQHLASGNIALPRGPKFNFLVVSVELTESMAYGDIIRQIATELKSEVGRQNSIQTAAKGLWDFLSKWEILGVKYHDGQRIEPSDFELLDQLSLGIEKTIKELGSRFGGLLILIDEADKPSEAAKLGEIIKLTTERLIKRDCTKLCFGLAGMPNLSQKLRAGHEASIRIFHNMTLEPLEGDERVSIINKCIEEAEQVNGFLVEINPEAIQQIAELSEGYPHFLQQFGYSAFDQDTDNKVDMDDVRAGLVKQNGALDQLGHKYFAELYFDKINSDDYRRVLQAMAENTDDWISRAEVIKKSKLKDTTVNNALKALKERNIIQSRDGGRGDYRLPTKSFAIWIKVSASTWDTTKKNKDVKA